MEVSAADEITDPILSVQITKFKCGGIAIGICISHRIIDACSFGTFISAWAKASLGDKSTEPLLRPNFDSPLYFPAENYDFGTIRSCKDTSTVTKRILFDRKAIETLRDKVSHLYKNSDRPPSRVLMVSSFLAEALLRSDHAKHVQMKARAWTLNAWLPLIGNNVKKAVSDCAKILSNGEDGHMILIDSFVGAIEKLNESGINGLRFTDWSKFKFYEADFGFGKPIWTSVANIPIRNLVMLMNTKENDGIEAWVHLDEKDISYFEQDVEIKKLIS
ncbi:HXXXD-type acyl-transferase family protein [Forsythia ovata]|uniref:HXXXD-type acyl-transferase family protein n=1 Tax=Forsythia ovata TaxID=205694 RepID=A0ABD1UXD4_9LAMI